MHSIWDVGVKMYDRKHKVDSSQGFFIIIRYLYRAKNVQSTQKATATRIVKQVELDGESALLGSCVFGSEPECNQFVYIYLNVHRIYIFHKQDFPMDLLTDEQING